VTLARAKLFGALVALSLLTGVLAGCGSGEGPYDGPQKTVEGAKPIDPAKKGTMPTAEP
jgi:predicted small lipoprotein YifL